MSFHFMLAVFLALFTINSQFSACYAVEQESKELNLNYLETKTRQTLDRIGEQIAQNRAMMEEMDKTSQAQIQHLNNLIDQLRGIQTQQSRPLLTLESESPALSRAEAAVEQTSNLMDKILDELTLREEELNLDFEIIQKALEQVMSNLPPTRAQPGSRRVLKARLAELEKALPHVSGISQAIEHVTPLTTARTEESAREHVANTAKILVAILSRLQSDHYLDTQTRVLLSSVGAQIILNAYVTAGKVNVNLRRASGLSSLVFLLAATGGFHLAQVPEATRILGTATALLLWVIWERTDPSLLRKPLLSRLAHPIRVANSSKELIPFFWNQVARYRPFLIPHGQYHGESLQQAFQILTHGLPPNSIFKSINRCDAIFAASSVFKSHLAESNNFYFNIKLDQSPTQNH